MSNDDAHEAAWHDDAVEKLRIDLENEKLRQADQAQLNRAQPSTPQGWTDQKLDKLLFDLTMLTEEDLEFIDRCYTTGTPEYEFVAKLTTLVRELIKKHSEQENQA